MANWDTFFIFAIAAMLCWATAVVMAFIRKERSGVEPLTVSFSLLGTLIYASFIALFWIELERPPMRTMGETRLWYSFFMGILGLVIYLKWRYRWMLLFSAVMSTVFIMINLLKPEIHTTGLMPALQSPWFVPHVTLYMFSYALLGCSFLLALYSLFLRRRKDVARGYLRAADNMVYIGMAFLTFGMLSGALWAKEAWGHYWSWDPKETWAAVTWLSYLGYIHLRTYAPDKVRSSCWALIVSFLFLQMCWYGVNYLPQSETSAHSYYRD